jgi:hypothetical protein
MTNATNISEANIVDLLSNLEIPIEPQPESYTVENIVNFSIATDSVVAIATVITDDTMRRIVIDWGDGETDTLNYRPGVPINPVFGEDDPLPPGTYQFSHAYDVSEDRKPFDHFVLLRVDDRNGGVDFRIIKITLIPRYRVTNYRTTVRLLGPCDGPFESTSEFDITQLVDGEIVNQWHWEPSNNFFAEAARFRLEGSIVTRELTVEDGAIGVYLDFVERDPLSDDDFSAASQHLSATYESERVERTLGSGDCRILVRYDREVSLIARLPFGTPVFA